MEEVVAATFAVPVTELRLPSRRSADVAFARQTAMYLAHVVFGLTHNSRQAVPPRPHHGAACMHGGRTTARQAAFDRTLQSLEDICVELSRGLKTPPQVRP
jgi:hypothetical protein